MPSLKTIYVAETALFYGLSWRFPLLLDAAMIATLEWGFPAMVAAVALRPAHCTP